MSLNAGAHPRTGPVCQPFHRRPRQGAEAFDRAATNLVTDVCAALALEFGPERMLELFDSIEASFPQLSPTLTAY
jgi:hypothetical protein